MVLPGYELSIRIAREEDLAQIVEIYNHAVVQRGATGDLTPVDTETRQEWFRIHTPEAHPIWVADLEGRILGWCSLSPYRQGRMALRYTAEISYYVHKDYRRQGIAGTMIRHALDRCPGLGIKSMFALLMDINLPSVRILEKCGFSRWGHMPDIAEFDGKTCGHLIYGRHL